MSIPSSNTHKNILNIALADDDEDDRMLFLEVIEEISIKTELDLNMPIKNGMQCLHEIRTNPALNEVSIAIYSTSSSERDIEETFVKGANIYLNKPNNFIKLRKSVEKIIQINWQYHTSNLNRDNFLFRL